MKLVIFVEGYTEEKVLPKFFKKWLDPQLAQPIGIKVVRFNGWRHYVDEIATKVSLNLSGKIGADVVGAIGLLAGLAGGDSLVARRHLQGDAGAEAAHAVGRDVHLVVLASARVRVPGQDHSGAVELAGQRGQITAGGGQANLRGVPGGLLRALGLRRRRVLGRGGSGGRALPPRRS